MKHILPFFLIFMLLVGCSVPQSAKIDTEATISAAIAQTQTAIPTLTATMAPTNTLAPTNTSKPTNTRAPTNTPKPTNTPRSTNTPESSGQDDILYYADKVATLSTNISKNLSNISTMSTMMGEDISLILNDDFKSMYFAELDSIYEDLLEIVTLTPPISLEKSHGYLVDAFTEFTLVRSLLKSGINDLNAEDISSGVEHMNLFSDYITLATEALGQ